MNRSPLDGGSIVLAPETGVKAANAEVAEGTSGPEIAAPSALLMEASTGQVIYEKNADEQRRPASITKIMTLILIFDAIDSGKIKMTDEVVTSAHAKSMGGSQVFLEEGEIQTVETLIKCIVVASGQRRQRRDGGIHSGNRAGIRADDERTGSRARHDGNPF